MKKDIELRKVRDVGIAIVPPDKGGINAELWDVYLINQGNNPLLNVLINSRGFGSRDEEEIKTSTFRFFYEEIPGRCAVKIEAIQSAIFDLAHEYWLSFNQDDYMYDRKFVFVRGSIAEENFTQVPILEKLGVMIL